MLHFFHGILLRNARNMSVFFSSSSSCFFQLTFDALSLTEPSSDFTLVSNLVKAEFANPTGEGVDGTYDFIQDESIPSNTKVTLDISAHNITGTVLVSGIFTYLDPLPTKMHLVFLKSCQEGQEIQKLSEIL